MTVPGGAEPQQGWVLAGPQALGKAVPAAHTQSHALTAKETRKKSREDLAGILQEALPPGVEGGPGGAAPSGDPITLPFLWEDGNQQAIGEVCARQDSFLGDPHLPSPPRPQGTQYPHPTSAPMLLWSPGHNSVIHFVNSDTD